MAVTAPHSGNSWHVLPISSCGLRLDDEAIRVAVGLRLGANLCEPHVCSCGDFVDARGTHGLACRQNVGRMLRHHHLNDMFCRSFARANIPSVKEPVGLSRSDGKRPDGMTLVPWQGGKCLTWDVTVVDTLAKSLLPITSQTQGGSVEEATSLKVAKYAPLTKNYAFAPIAFETLGPINASGKSLIQDLGKRMSAVTGDERETAFLSQRLSVLIQRFNSISFRGSFLTNTEF